MNDIDSWGSCRVAKGHLELLQRPASVPAEEARFGGPRHVLLSPLEFVALITRTSMTACTSGHYFSFIRLVTLWWMYIAMHHQHLSVGITQVAELGVAALSQVPVLNRSTRRSLLRQLKLRLPRRVIL